jgi:hypothetical protein
MAQYRYRPKDNRTPVSHPVIGHLTWDGIYDHPDCAGHPDFEEITPEPEENPGSGPEPGTADTVDEPADKPSAAKATGAGKTGRSTKA